MATLSQGQGSTTNTSGIFIPEQWAKEAEFARDNEYVVANLVERKYEDVLDFGSKVHVPFVANIAAADDVVPGAAVTPVAPTELETAILINKFKAKAVQISDIVTKQAKYNLAEIYGKQIGKVLAKTIDTDVLVELQAGSSGRSGDNAPATTNLAASTAPTYAQIVALVTLLDAANVPADDRSFVVNSKLMGDLRTMAEFTRYDAIGSANPSVATDQARSLVGHIYGVPVYMTNNVQSVTVTIARDQNIMFHKSAVGLVIQKAPTMEKDRTSLNLADDIIGSQIYGVKKLRNDHVAILARN